MRETALVAPIIVNWNNVGLTLQTLASLAQQRYPRLCTILVDNGSADQAEAMARVAAAHPDVRTISSSDNLGYGGGCNLGMKLGLELGADYLLPLNNDVTLDPEAIGELVEALEADARAGAAGPLLYYASDPQTIWFGGGRVVMGPRVLQRHEHEGERYAPGDDPPRETDWLVGTAILARRAAVEKAGLIDTAYFMYWEDVDWCYRLRRAGYRLLIVPRARLWHQVNASTPRGSNLQYYWERNRLLFTERWGTRSARLAAMAKVYARLALWRLMDGSRDSVARLRREAYRDYLGRRFGPRREPPSS